jgi:hypothetical protein
MIAASNASVAPRPRDDYFVTLALNSRVWLAWLVRPAFNFFF